MTNPKRKYVRLAPAVWAEIRALWELGEVTLAELSGIYGVSPRTLQTHFAKHHTIQGSKAALVATAVKEKIFAEQLNQPDLVASRAKETREKAYNNAVTIENLIMAQLDEAKKDPSKAIKATTAIKVLSLAAAGVERLHDLKWRALGLDKGGIEPDELPVLIFRDLSTEEIYEIQRGHGEDGSTEEPDEDVELVPSDHDNDDDVVDTTRNESVKESTDTDATRTTVDGYRLVREACD